MTASDVCLHQISEAFPEQYDALDGSGNIMGYLRVRWGYFIVWCPDVNSEDVVYEVDLKTRLGFFSSNKKRKKHLRRAKAAIAAWWNKQNIILEEN